MSDSAPNITVEATVVRGTPATIQVENSGDASPDEVVVIDRQTKEEVDLEVSGGKGVLSVSVPKVEDLLELDVQIPKATDTSLTGGLSVGMILRP